MCISCKIYGTHSEGPMAAHPLEKISDYFAEIAAKINEMDPNLEKRKDQLEELLATVDSKVKEINRTTAQIQSDLTQMFNDALRDLQLISRRKLSYLISDQLEIRRQYDYIQWMESFLKYEFNVLPPNSFLASWIKYPPPHAGTLSSGRTSSISTTSPPPLMSSPTSASMAAYASLRMNALGTSRMNTGMVVRASLPPSSQLPLRTRRRSRRNRRKV
jgi:hypothetical protein